MAKGLASMVHSLVFLFAACTLSLTLVAQSFSATIVNLVFRHILLFKICWYEDFWNSSASYIVLFLEDGKLGFSLPLMLWFHEPQACDF